MITPPMECPAHEGATIVCTCRGHVALADYEKIGDIAILHRIGEPADVDWAAKYDEVRGIPPLGLGFGFDRED